MIRGIKWLLGTLGLAGSLLLALNGLCSNPGSFPALSEFFCPRAKGARVPRPGAAGEAGAAGGR